MRLRLNNTDFGIGNTTSPSQRPIDSSYSVEEDFETVYIRRHIGDGGMHATFDDAKKFAIYLLELKKEDLDEQIDNFSFAQTFDCLKSGGLSGGTLTDDEIRGDHLRVVDPTGDCCDE